MEKKRQAAKTPFHTGGGKGMEGEGKVMEGMEGGEKGEEGDGGGKKGGEGVERIGRIWRGGGGRAEGRTTDAKQHCVTSNNIV